MQVEQRDGSFDYQQAADITRRSSPSGQHARSGLQRLVTIVPRRRAAYRVAVDRAKAETLQVSVGDVFADARPPISDRATSTSSTNSAGPSRSMCRPIRSFARGRRISEAQCAEPGRQDGADRRIGAGQPAIGPSLISLYNLYPRATIVGAPAPGFSSGQAMDLMEQIADADPAAGRGLRVDRRCPIRRRRSATSSSTSFGLAILLVYLCLAGQYESWIAPLAVILAVPLALLGPVVALSTLGLANNLYTQIGLMLLIALAAKNAHPDRRGRARAAAARGRADPGSGGRRGRTAAPADPDDLVRLHPRRGAAGPRDRSRAPLPASPSASASSAA